MKRTAFLFVLTACTVGCASQTKDAAASATPVNKVCAVMHEHPVEAKDPATVSWKGQTVGFCCADCVDEWKNLSAAEKDKALATAMAAK
jgi:hypothetical protein